jgi:hypothetical protein
MMYDKHKCICANIVHKITYTKRIHWNDILLDHKFHPIAIVRYRSIEIITIPLQNSWKWTIRETLDQ